MSESGSKATVSEAKKTRKDRSVWSLIAVVLVIAVLAAAPTVWVIRQNSKYKAYMNDFSDELFKGERFDKIEIEYDGERIHLTPDQGRWIYIRLTLAGQGIPCDKKDVGDVEQALLDLGHGATVLMAETRMSDDHNSDRPGLYVEYHYANGKEYIYETDGTTMYYIKQPIEEAKAAS